jgi:hypothetical protein
MLMSERAVNTTLPTANQLPHDASRTLNNVIYVPEIATVSAAYREAASARRRDASEEGVSHDNLNRICGAATGTERV